ncbi:unnamed protein product [Sympodiomycopsis kandeliae]
MKVFNVVSAALLVAGAASASSSGDSSDVLFEHLDHPGDAHRVLSRRTTQDRILARHSHKSRNAHKKCNKTSKKAKASQQNHAKQANTSSSSSKHTSHAKSSHDHSSNKKGNNDDGNNDDGSKHSHSKGSSHSHSSGGGSGKGLFGMSFSDSQCSKPDADDERPNGSVDFLTCGISKSNRNSKWQPADVKMSDVKMIGAEQAASSDVFKPCAKYKSTFEKVSQDTGVPAVLLMSFALQESTCNAGLTGDNGEIGISQITPDKCNGAPGGNCHDVYFNLKTAANYFKNTLENQCNGNVLCAVGQYNGWQAGKMTYASATNQQYGCMAQNNLDYLDSLLNGFCQGKDGHSKTYRHFGNIAHC